MRPWPDLPRPVLVLVAARAVNQLGAFTLPFLAVVLVRERHASLATAGLVTALFGVATIPSRLAGGRLADRIGNRATVVLGLTGCAGAQLAIALGTSLAQAMVAAAVLGLAFELYEPPSQAMIADLTDAESRPRAFGLFGAALAAGGAGAGLLATVLGSVDLRLLFVVDAGTCLACAAVVGLALPESARRTSREPVTASPWRDPRLLAMLAVGTCFATLYLQIRVGLPLTMVERGLPAAQFGVLMTVSSVTVVLAQPLLASRLVPGNPFGAMRVGYLVLGAGPGRHRLGVRPGRLPRDHGRVERRRRAAARAPLRDRLRAGPGGGPRPLPRGVRHLLGLRRRPRPAPRHPTPRHRRPPSALAHLRRPRARSRRCSSRRCAGS